MQLLPAQLSQSRQPQPLKHRHAPPPARERAEKDDSRRLGRNLHKVHQDRKKEDARTAYDKGVAAKSKTGLKACFLLSCLFKFTQKKFFHSANV